MLAIPGIVLIVLFIYVRPQEYFDSLKEVPFLYVFLAATIFGALLDLRMRNLRLRSTPLLPWIVAFFIWCAFTVLIRAPRSAAPALTGLSICAALYFSIAHGIQSFRALHVVAGTVLVVVLFVCFVGVHQGLAPMGCVVVDPSTRGDTTAGTPDGRPCDSIRSCYLGDVEPGADYACEHIGLFGTTSVGGGRVRYLGVLQDPNELALAGGVGLPLSFALAGRRRKVFLRRSVCLIAVALVLLCTLFTESRGGQIVLATVAGAYVLHRFGAKGLLIAPLAAAPLLLIGGRSGAEASSSTVERLDCWAAALSIWQSHPLLGVGLGQFTEYNYMTAHNAYLLTLAELGIPGMLLFSIVLYLSAKIPFVILRDVVGAPGAEADESQGASAARSWATGLMAAFAGLAVGIFFLSFAYHYVLWIYIGLSGALYSAVRAHHGRLGVRFGAADAAIVVAADVAIVLFVHVYTRWARA